MVNEQGGLGNRPDLWTSIGYEPTTSATAPPGLTLLEFILPNNYTDQLGRLVYEDSAPMDAIEDAEEAGILMTRTACPYTDTPSRLGAPMNSAAYEARQSENPKMHAGLVWLRDQYIAQNGSVPTNTPEGLYEIGRLGEEALIVAINQADSPFDAYGDLPPYITSIFQSGRALWTAAFHMMNRGKYEKSQPITAKDVLAFAENNGLYVRHDDPTDKKKVTLGCAAPTGLIRASINDALTGGKKNPVESQLEQDIDFQMLWDFHRLKAGFQTELNKYWKAVVAPLQQAGIAFDEMERYRIQVPGGDIIQVTDLANKFLDGAMTIQDAMNGVLGRRVDAPRLTLDQIWKGLKFNK